METNNFEEALLYFDHNAKYAYRYINTFIVSPNFYEQVVSKYPRCNVYRFVISEGFTQMYGISFLQDGEVPIGYNAYLLNLKHWLYDGCTEHNKRVRDRIPEIIRKEGKEADSIILDDKQYLFELKAKLIEEVTEVSLSKNREEVVSELADVREGMDALMQVYEISPMEVSTIQVLKAIKRGKFEKKINLKEVKWV